MFDLRARMDSRVAYAKVWAGCGASLRELANSIILKYLVCGIWK